MREEKPKKTQKSNLKWLTDPTVFRVNRLDAHSDHVCYASEEETLNGGIFTSLRQSLDGIWRFMWSPSIESRPADFYREDFDDSKFDKIPVPAHMELHGFGQIQYINTLYPWDGHADIKPPEIDREDSPVGSYRFMFDLEPGLRGKRVCVSFQGVEQAFYVWLNGHFIGYAEDSFTPSDFDLTGYIRETHNLLCVEVHKHSSAAWIEDQDFFRFSGIFRSVFLYAKPDVHVEDVWFRTELNDDYLSGSLKIRLLFSGDMESARVSCKIQDPDEEEIINGVIMYIIESRNILTPQNGLNIYRGRTQDSIMPTEISGSDSMEQ